MDDPAIFIGSYTECIPLPHLANPIKNMFGTVIIIIF